MNEQATENTLESLGAHLRKARELQGLEVSRLAVELRLLESHILDLESGRYNHIKSPVFARGYLRQYARRLGIDPEAAVAWFDRASTGLFRTETALPRLRRRRPVMPGLLRGTVVILGVIALAALGWYLFGVYRDSVSTAVAPVVTAVSPTYTAPAEPPGFAETEEVVPPEEPEYPQAPDDLPESSASSLAAADAAATSGAELTSVDDVATAAATELQLSFSGDCWVEVRDATRETLMADLKKSGDQVRLQGVPPYSVLLGNAAAARVTYQGRTIPVESDPGKLTASLSVGE